jgi:hypothetical protein
MSTPNTKSDRKKPKLVRDSFTIPKLEYAAIDALKTRAIAQGNSVKKSELLRAGLLALQAMTDAQFKAAVAAVPQLKTGRPAAQAAVSAAAPALSDAVKKAPRSAATQAKATVRAQDSTPAAKPVRVARKPAVATKTGPVAAPARGRGKPAA